MNLRPFYICWVALALVGIGSTVRARHVLRSDARLERVDKLRSAQYRKKAQDYTLGKLEARYKRDSINVGKTEDAETSQITKGMDLAFNHCTNNSEYSKNQEKIKSLLGAKMSADVLSTVKPTQNMNPDFRKPRSMSAKMNYCHVSYGELQSVSGTTSIPMEVNVQYQTPPYSNDAGAVNNKKAAAEKSEPHTENIVFKGVYIAGHGFQLEHTFNTLGNNDNQ